jgi:hypothetical protein
VCCYWHTGILGGKRKPGAVGSRSPKRAIAEKAKPAKMPSRAKKLATKPKADRANKKADVVAMLKRAEGARLSEIMAATEWQARTVRGFGSILGRKGGDKIESSKNAAGERTYKIEK